jgi:hypothetical protein
VASMPDPSAALGQAYLPCGPRHAHQNAVGNLVDHVRRRSRACESRCRGSCQALTSPAPSETHSRRSGRCSSEAHPTRRQTRALASRRSPPSSPQRRCPTRNGSCLEERRRDVGSEISEERATAAGTAFYTRRQPPLTIWLTIAGELRFDPSWRFCFQADDRRADAARRECAFKEIVPSTSSA